MLLRWFLFFTFSSCCCFAEAALRCDTFFPQNLISPSLVDDSVSSEEIQQMIAESRKSLREQSFRVSYQEFFARVLNQPAEAYESLSPQESLAYLTLFARWRLLPSDKWSAFFLQIVERQIFEWSNESFLTFALQRKLTPLVFPESFVASYYQRLREIFPSLNVTTQLETLSAELYHDGELKHSLSTEDLSFFIRVLTENLKNLPESLPGNLPANLHIKPVKEMYRGLLFLKNDVRTSLTYEISLLIEQLERKLQYYNISLADGGKSGDTRHRSSPDDSRYQILEIDLQLLFRGSELITEYSDAQLPGFYDAVDILVVDARLVVEWDGGHHYFRPLLMDGSILNEQDDLVLRPLDRARDRLLRTQGYRILRISPPLANQLHNLDIETLINEQNP